MAPATESDERVSASNHTARSGTPSASSCAAIQRPACPPRSAAAVTSPPSAAAARATFRPLPPGTCANSAGRWISPGVSRSTANRRSTEGLAATHRITAAPPPPRRGSAGRRCRRVRGSRARRRRTPARARPRPPRPEATRPGSRRRSCRRRRWHRPDSTRTPGWRPPRPRCAPRRPRAPRFTTTSGHAAVSMRGALVLVHEEQVDGRPEARAARHAHAPGRVVLRVERDRHAGGMGGGDERREPRPQAVEQEVGGDVEVPGPSEDGRVDVGERERRDRPLRGQDRAVVTACTARP